LVCEDIKKRGFLYFKVLYNNTYDLGIIFKLGRFKGGRRSTEMKTTQQNTISPRTFAYLRVSTDGQDLDKFKSEILLFAHKKGWGNVEFVEEKVSGKVGILEVVREEDQAPY